jgi:hypothetical protein
MHVAFFYCNAETLSPDEGFQLQPPSYLAFLRADNGEFEEIRAVGPADFGQGHGGDEWIGRYLSPPERVAPDFLTKQVRMYQAYDVLVPCFAARETLPLETRNLATDFMTLFAQVTETPLQPYYLIQGTEFFSWLNQVAANTQH